MVRAKQPKKRLQVLFLLLFLGGPAAQARDSASISQASGNAETAIAANTETALERNREIDLPGQGTASYPTASSQSGQPDKGTEPNSSAGQSILKTGQPAQGHRLYRAWRQMADREEATEPNWLSPLATTSGRIKDELRYDIWRQATPTGGTISTFAGGKGLEFIAAPHVQLLLGIPSYLDHSAGKSPDGFGDLPLMIKIRLASANVDDGNYLVTFLLSATAPTGPQPNGAGAAVLTPTLALGKGWGHFDVQTTFGANLPAADTQRLGKQLLWNTTLQYRAGWKLWPELETNATFFEQGPNAGRTQTFLTPGLGFGRVRLARGLRFSVAGGRQFALTHFHTYDHRWMLSVRFPF